MKLWLIIAALFSFSCCKPQEDTTCVTHTDITTLAENYVETDTTTGLRGQTTLSFSLKSSKRVYDRGVCDFGKTPECTNELTVTNLTSKNLMLTYATIYTQSILPKATSVVYVGNETIVCGLSLAVVKQNLKIKYQ